jgi:hypothetical protein
MVQEAGFLGAVTVNNRAFDVAFGDWFQMDRIPVFSGGQGQPAWNSRADFLSLIGESLR